jgi:hypothetical protein
MDRSDRHHAACRALIERAEEMRIIPAATLPELDYLLAQRVGPGAMLALLRDIRAGVFVVEDLEFEDLERIGDLIDTYADLDVGYVDAAVLATVERMGEPKLATLDRRHFAAMRPRHVEALALVPA